MMHVKRLWVPEKARSLGAQLVSVTEARQIDAVGGNHGSFQLMNAANIPDTPQDVSLNRGIPCTLCWDVGTGQLLDATHLTDVGGSV